MRLMTRLAMAALVVGATACGDSSGLDDDVEGTYTLRTVNGGQMPYTVFQGPGFKLEIVSSTLVVRDNNTWTETATIRETEGTTVTTSTTVVNGTYTMNGNSATFTDSDGDTLTAIFSGGDTLTASATEDGFTFTFVYRK